MYTYMYADMRISIRLSIYLSKLGAQKHFGVSGSLSYQALVRWDLLCAGARFRVRADASLVSPGQGRLHDSMTLLQMLQP